MGALLVGVEKVAHITSRCHTYEALYRQELQGEAALSDLEASLVALYEVVLTFLSHALKLFGNSGARRAMHAALNAGALEEVITQLETHEASVERDACNCERVFQRTAHGELAKQLQSLLAQFRAPLLRIDSGVEALLDRSDQLDRVAALQWASKIPYESNHITAREGRTENTAEWILQHPTYREWRASSASMIIWLHGIRKFLLWPPFELLSLFSFLPLRLTEQFFVAAGAGKTKLVSRVIDDIGEQLKSQPNNEAFAYFYFNRNDPNRCNPSAALCSLTRQLSLTADGRGMHSALVRLYKSKLTRGMALDKIDDEAATQLLREFVDAFPQTTLVLDALDECDEAVRMEFVDLLESLARDATKPIKIFISSRLDSDITERLKGGPNVAITATDNQNDITVFVEAEIAKRPLWKQKLSEQLRSEVVHTLCVRSRGM
jgi:hypothetical protein